MAHVLLCIIDMRGLLIFFFLLSRDDLSDTKCDLGLSHCEQITGIHATSTKCRLAYTKYATSVKVSVSP